MKKQIAKEKEKRRRFSFEISNEEGSSYIAFLENQDRCQSMADVIEMTSHQQQDSSDSTVPKNNGNDRKSVSITALLETVASRLGLLVCGWAVLLLVQGGIVPTMETKDRVFVTVMFFLVCLRCWRYFCPQDTGSFTEATQSLLADNSSIENNIQQLTLPIRFIRRLFYWWKLVAAMTSVVLSIMRLVSQDFGQTEGANKATRDFALNVFYGLTLTEALVLLFALTLMAMLRVNTASRIWRDKKFEEHL